MSLPPQIVVTEVLALLDQGAVLVDVRELDETSAGRAPQAILNPMLSFDLASVPEDTPLLVICHSGGRSQQVTQALRQRGYDASNVVGGMVAWAAAGLPVVDLNGQPGIIA
ncbi:MAG: rhodanese-like domain-containing protein [Actinomycetales bacterium]|nr:rhodanese-like domain-containing protein [Actinomycetales bacterium]